MSDPFVNACVGNTTRPCAAGSNFGRLLGEVISSQSGTDVVRAVERLRKGFIATAQRSRPEAPGTRQIKKFINKLSPDACARSFAPSASTFQLVNTAEESFQHRQRRRIRLTAACCGADRSDACMRDLRDMGVDPEELQDLFEEIRYMPVFTAHPTESKRRSIMLQMRRIFETTRRWTNRQTAIDYKETHTRNLRTSRHCGKPTRSASRPDVRPRSAWACTISARPCLTRYPWSIDAWKARSERLPRPPRFSTASTPAMIRFGSWIGGDRDGNPNVTAATTREAILTQHLTILQEYFQRVEDLIGILTQSQDFCTPSLHSPPACVWTTTTARSSTRNGRHVSRRALPPQAVHHGTAPAAAQQRGAARMDGRHC